MSEKKDILKRADLPETEVKFQKNLLTFREAQAYLGFSASYLYKLSYTRRIPCYKPTHRALFYFRDELDEWVKKGKVKLRGRKKDETG